MKSLCDNKKHHWSYRYRSRSIYLIQKDLRERQRVWQWTSIQSLDLARSRSRFKIKQFLWQIQQNRGYRKYTILLESFLSIQIITSSRSSNLYLIVQQVEVLPVVFDSLFIMACNRQNLRSVSIQKYQFILSFHICIHIHSELRI